MSGFDKFAEDALNTHVKYNPGQPSLVSDPIIIFDAKKELSNVYTLKVINGKKVSLRYKIAEILLEIAGKIARMDVEMVERPANNAMNSDQNSAG